MPGTRAAQQSTKTIPIVIATTSDAVGTGLVASLAASGGNTTGSTVLNQELVGKRLELLKKAIPGLTQVGVLLNAGNPSNGSIRMLESAARPLKLGLQRIDVRGPEEFEGARLRRWPKRA